MRSRRDRQHRQVRRLGPTPNLPRRSRTRSPRQAGAAQGARRRRGWILRVARRDAPRSGHRATQPRPLRAGRDPRRFDGLRRRRRRSTARRTRRGHHQRRSGVRLHRRADGVSSCSCAPRCRRPISPPRAPPTTSPSQPLRSLTDEAGIPDHRHRHARRSQHGDAGRLRQPRAARALGRARPVPHGGHRRRPPPEHLAVPVQSPAAADDGARSRRRRGRANSRRSRVPSRPCSRPHPAPA